MGMFVLLLIVEFFEVGCMWIRRVGTSGWVVDNVILGCTSRGNRCLLQLRDFSPSSELCHKVNSTV